MNLDARIKEARKVRRGHNNGDGRRGRVGISSEDVHDLFSTWYDAVVSGIVSRLSSSIRTVGGASSPNWPSELAKSTGSISSSMSTSFGDSSKRGSS